MRIKLDDPVGVVESYAILHESADCVVVYINSAVKRPFIAFSGPEVYISSCTLRIEDFCENVSSYGEASRYEVFLTFLNRDKVVEAINGQRNAPIQS